MEEEIPFITKLLTGASSLFGKAAEGVGKELRTGNTAEKIGRNVRWSTSIRPGLLNAGKSFSEGPIGTAGKFAGRVGSRAGTGAMNMGRLMDGSRLKYAIGGAAALGFASRRPFRGAITNIVGGGILDTSQLFTHSAVDPTVTARHAQANSSNYAYLSGEPPTSTRPQPGSRLGYYNPSAPSVEGPPGDIVFGMHALRA